MNVLLFQVDGKLPNFALMRLSTWHRAKGDQVEIRSHLPVDLPWTPDLSYCSSIFSYSGERRKQLKSQFPEAIVGGDGYFPVWNDLTIIGREKGSNLREVIRDVDPQTLLPDYSHYPSFLASLGYSQRGCRLNCDFCRMQTREGKPKNVSPINSIWRGHPYPKHIHLLDNDFFGQPEWRDLIKEMVDGNFKICFNQGINIRLVNAEQAKELSRVKYVDDSFKTKRLYTAWDNLGDEQIFKKGVAELSEGGIPSRHLMVYMLIGFNPKETEEEVVYRFNELISLGCKPYPMVFDRTKLLQCRFQKWIVRRYYEVCSWPEFKANHKSQYQWNEVVQYTSRYNKGWN